jgi:Domain of unknown function (DUF3943)
MVVTMSGNAWPLTAAWRRVVVLVALALGSRVLPALAEHGDDWSSTPYRLLPDRSLRGPPDEYVIGGDDELAPSVRDWVGLGRDTAFLIGYQILGAAESFLYSTVASTIYESGVEAFFEPPSYQDLIVTPIGGSLLGGLVFEPLRNWIRQKPERAWYDRVELKVPWK